MLQERQSISYKVRYEIPGMKGICSLPIWVPFDVNPMEFARKTLSNVHPGGYKIIELRPDIPDKLSDEQIALNEKYVERIMFKLSEMSMD